MENELTDLTTDEALENMTETITEEVTEETAEQTDALADALAFEYDYYEKVLDKMDDTITNQQLIIDNQEDIKAHNTQLLGINSCILFIFGVCLIYQILRNMIIVK